MWLNDDVHDPEVERLVDLMWPDAPPRPAVRVSASSLRDTAVTVDAAGWGYVLHADLMTIDAHRSRHLVTQAGATVDDPARLALLD